MSELLYYITEAWCMLGFFVLSLHNLPLCHQGKINTKYAVISSKQLQITVHRTTHYSQFHLLAEFSKNLYRMPFFAVCAEDELKWKFKPDTLAFCLLRIFLQLFALPLVLGKPERHLLVPGPYQPRVRCVACSDCLSKSWNDFYVTRRKLLFKMA